MQIKSFYLYLFIVLSLCVSSCTQHAYYATNAHHVSMFQEKNEANIGLNFISGNQYAGLEIQGAYSITENIAVRASHMSGSGDGATTGFGVGVLSSTPEGEGKYSEFGAGYYRPFATGSFTFESFGGWGFGEIKNIYGGGGFSEVKYHKTYIQPALGYQNRWAALIFSYRIAFLQYYNVRQNAIVSEIHSRDLDLIANNSQAVLSEYAFTVRALFSYYKLNLQIGKATLINRPNLPVDDLTVSIGLTIDIHNLWKEKEK